MSDVEQPEAAQVAAPAVVEAEPAAAAEFFGEHIDGVRAFAAALTKHGEELGLIGPLELPRLWTRHLLNSGLVAPLLRPGRVADVGSGAGLPGLVLAIQRPDVDFVLIEPMERRVAWLERQVAELGLQNVTVVRARSEEARMDDSFTQVTARAVSALRTLIPITAPLLKDGGELVLMKGSSVEREIDAAAKVFRKYRVTEPEVLVLGEGIVPEAELTRVFRAIVH
ncbi:16S rRNA (guanine(527)-N(7))-methyltransferase RsmG [Agromyces seonyuensis]|uniref:Ribosomal RNA small subunit methyltransferase G n=1 Tax=Agromyces seonyuensis TaxID=2662446 RepID=A0A6I4NTA5_9MICO|nr:16S rRNA (guanine(527)-N(7))-methyltransferase RsmG [Agromyces seonyuensis]MWB97440.1 16S rRNA (guanine(527)-N(7))-methyltransferase RsmG [Agromyces seonyuensis]